MQLWLCGQFRAVIDGATAWDFQGIFDERNKAIAACKKARYFITPVTLNDELPEGISDMPETFYPLG